MAVNPMKRKAMTSFLLGMVITLLFTGLIIGLLLMRLVEIKKKEKEEAEKLANVYILNEDVKSGEILRKDMFSIKSMPLDTIPSNATANEVKIDAWFLKTDKDEYVYGDKEGWYIQNRREYFIVETDKNGKTTINDEEVEIKKDDVQEDEYGYFARIENEQVKSSDEVLSNEKEKIRIYQDAETNEYYVYEINSNGNGRQKVYIKLNDINVLAKTELKANTVITSDLITRSDKAIVNSTRRQEYNMIVLPIDLVTDNYVDIRLMLPTGEDYIVLSKKIVEVANINGIDSEDTIYLNLTEEEILTLSCAIVEAYWINGSKLYATKYVDAGLQEAALTTYPLNENAIKLINVNTNILEEARNALFNRYKVEVDKNLVEQRNIINDKKNSAGEEGLTNVESKMQESITTTKEDRKEYLEGI